MACVCQVQFVIAYLTPSFDALFTGHRAPGGGDGVRQGGAGGHRGAAGGAVQGAARPHPGSCILSLHPSTGS